MLSIPEIEAFYLAAHERIDGLVRDLPDEDLAVPAAACPGWSVADVVAHCTGIVEDALAGRLSGPPDEDQTAVQVERHRGRPIVEVLDIWAAGAAPFAEVIAAAGVAPALIDVLSHEHDIRTALGRPGHRDDPAVVLAATMTITGLDVSPHVIEVEYPDGSTVRSASGEENADGPVTVLRATPFEVLRFRLGRRSPEEIKAMDWSADPAAFLPQLFVFGTREQSLGE